MIQDFRDQQVMENLAFKVVFLGKMTTYLGGGNSHIFYFHPYLAKISILTNIFQRGWKPPTIVICWWFEVGCFCLCQQSSESRIFWRQQDSSKQGVVCWWSCCRVLGHLVVWKNHASLTSKPRGIQLRILMLHILWFMGIMGGQKTTK